jgi:hypothetical protein
MKRDNMVDGNYKFDLKNNLNVGECIIF